MAKLIEETFLQVQPYIPSVNSLKNKAPSLIYSTLSHTYQIICQKIGKQRTWVTFVDISNTEETNKLRCC